MLTPNETAPYASDATGETELNRQKKSMLISRYGEVEMAYQNINSFYSDSENYINSFYSDSENYTGVEIKEEKKEKLENFYKEFNGVLDQFLGTPDHYEYLQEQCTSLANKILEELDFPQKRACLERLMQGLANLDERAYPESSRIRELKKEAKKHLDSLKSEKSGKNFKSAKQWLREATEFTDQIKDFAEESFETNMLASVSIKYANRANFAKAVKESFPKENPSVKSQPKFEPLISHLQTYHKKENLPQSSSVLEILGMIGSTLAAVISNPFSAIADALNGFIGNPQPGVVLPSVNSKQGSNAFEDAMKIVNDGHRVLPPVPARQSLSGASVTMFAKKPAENALHFRNQRAADLVQEKQKSVVAQRGEVFDYHPQSMTISQ